MQPNLKTFLEIAVLVAVVLFAGLLYYLIYLNSVDQLLAIIFGCVVLVFGGYAAVYLFELTDVKKKGATTADNIAEPKPDTDAAAIANLPKLLNNRAAIALLNRLRDAGFLDEQFQPAPNMPLCQKAYIAGSLCEMLNTDQRWGAFEKFWQCFGLRQSYINACKRDTVQDWRTDVYRTLVDVGSSNCLIFDTCSFTRWVRNDKPNQ